MRKVKQAQKHFYFRFISDLLLYAPALLTYFVCFMEHKNLCSFLNIVKDEKFVQYEKFGKLFKNTDEHIWYSEVYTSFFTFDFLNHFILLHIVLCFIYSRSNDCYCHDAVI